MAIRNNVNSVAWYLVHAQIPLNLTAILTTWRVMAWKFFEAPENVTEFSDSHCSAVSILTQIQDYHEGGNDVKTSNLSRAAYTKAKLTLSCSIQSTRHQKAST